MQQWEYMILSETLQEGVDKTWWEWTDTGKTIAEQPLKNRLDESGKQGWELVSVSNSQRDGYTTFVAYYFKRPLD
jgi:hypothetical protein